MPGGDASVADAVPPPGSGWLCTVQPRKALP